MTDQEHAEAHRPPLLEFREEHHETFTNQSGTQTTGSAARWPEPFEDDDLDLPEEDMWWTI